MHLLPHPSRVRGLKEINAFVIMLCAVVTLVITILKRKK